MSYTEAAFTLFSGNDESVEQLMAWLSDAGFESFMETTEGFNAYILSSFYDDAIIRQCLSRLPQTAKFTYTTRTIEDKNWNEAWEQNFNPVLINDQCCIRAAFHPVPEKIKYDLLIHPKMSFGTGHHETTTLMITAMLTLDFEDKTVVDMGCGTGVLAILAAKMGARHITAIDIDQWAVTNCAENCLLNHTPWIKIIQGDSTALGQSKSDYILANISRNVLLADIPVYSSHLSTGGLLVLSGFYADDVPLIRQKAASEKLSVKSMFENNRWAVMVLEKE